MGVPGGQRWEGTPRRLGRTPATLSEEALVELCAHSLRPRTRGCERWKLSLRWGSVRNRALLLPHNCREFGGVTPLLRAPTCPYLLHPVLHFPFTIWMTFTPPSPTATCPAWCRRAPSVRTCTSACGWFPGRSPYMRPQGIMWCIPLTTTLHGERSLRDVSNGGRRPVSSTEDLCPANPPV
jgi:hypothetical protein